MNWRNNFQSGRELVLATSSKSGKPNANVVISLGFFKDKLMVADCSMVTTIKNLKVNPRICVVGGYFKIIGKTRLVSAGPLFKKCVAIVASQDKTLTVKNAILVSISAVFDLANIKKIV
ncbi:MAG: pyridoxamine 5'-phosphate oxidase family protein [Parcubacteria group bacterium]